MKQHCLAFSDLYGLVLRRLCVQPCMEEGLWWCFVRELVSFRVFRVFRVFEQNQWLLDAFRVLGW